ncbi:hypothetical protein ACFVT5_07515 [Streptomyces sp. NPDC058001]|uniref:hypothetical protein n=1 Tax=Streptomyces sp. NPDC058001 TaxID=3346300 RepID=UPI0036EFFB41
MPTDSFSVNAGNPPRTEPQASPEDADRPDEDISGPDPGPGPDLGPDAGPDPADRLTRTVVVARSLDEVLRLITLLEESPEHARIAAEAVRAAAVERPVDDVTRMVDSLSRPPHSPDTADAAIRTATEQRTVDDVSRLMTLLHRPPHDPRVADEAVRSAAASRTVEELAELIGRLGNEKAASAPPPPDASLSPDAPWSDGPSSAGDDAEKRSARQSTVAIAPLVTSIRPVSVRRPSGRTGGLPLWLRWLAAVAFLACGVANLPLYGHGAPAYVYGALLAAAVLCLVAALVVPLFGRGTAIAVVVAVVASGALAAARLVPTGGRARAVGDALEYTLAPGGVATGAALAAVVAGIAALLALAGVFDRNKDAGRPRYGTPVLMSDRGVD